MNKKGQVFSALIIVVLALFIFIFAAPIIAQSIAIGVSQTGGATGFFMRLYPWVIIIFILLVLLRIITSGADL